MAVTASGCYLQHKRLHTSRELAGQGLDRRDHHDQDPRKGTSRGRHLFTSSPRTAPEALLRLIRQRWSPENE